MIVLIMLFHQEPKKNIDKIMLINLNNIVNNIIKIIKKVYKNIDKIMLINLNNIINNIIKLIKIKLNNIINNK